MCVDLVLEQKKVKWAFKHADRLGAEYIAILAPDEAARGLVRIKRLSDGEQVELPAEELADWIASDDILRLAARERDEE